MIYGFFSTIFFIIILPFWLIAGLFKPKLLVGFKEKLGFYKSLEACGMGRCDESKTVVFYGVSVGEVCAMENLIKKTREKFSNLKIVVLTGTQTGQEIAKKKFTKIADFISYFPLDFPFCVENMIQKLKPDMIFVMETELWPNFAHITKQNNIPFYIINARISDRTHKSYKKLKLFFEPILKEYTGIFPQSKEDSEKLVSIGANPKTTKIMGNLKFDIKKPDITTIEHKKISNHKVILAGSTHFGEEEIILDAFSKLKEEIQNLKLIIAPRHPERNEKVFELIKKRGLLAGKRSLKDSLEEKEVLLLDTMGELGKLYSQCDVAFIGGSFPKKGGDNYEKKGVGGHNPLEATIFNKPAISGPSIHNFKDIYSILKNAKAAKIVSTKEELIEELKNFLKNEIDYSFAEKACEQVFEDNSGALDFVIDVLQSLV